MMKTTLSKKIELENFSPRQIAESGQCFRMNPESDGSFAVVAHGRICKLNRQNRQNDSGPVELFFQDEKDLKIWEEYFHLDYDYGAVVKGLLESKDDFLQKAADFGSGLRILRQETFETLISFIISQNNNIPKIKSSIEKLCENYGEEKFWDRENLKYFTFPQPETLAELPPEALRAAGLGYRDSYVKNAATAVAEGRLNLTELEKLETEALMEELMAIKGVGKKVASCVALFGFGKMDAVPVDVWIERVNKEIYGGYFHWEDHREIAGLVQQYFFYYMRNRDK